MPLGQAPLGELEIGVLRAWIDEGAEWNPNTHPLQDSSIEPRRPEVPANGHTHPIDAFVARYTKAKGLSDCVAGLGRCFPSTGLAGPHRIAAVS